MKQVPRLSATLATALALPFFASCQPEDSSTATAPSAPEDPPTSHAATSTPQIDYHHSGTQLVAQAFGVLSSNLNAAIARSGPASALEYCSVNVAPLTESVAGQHAVEIRRVTHRARNPANQATPDELQLLETFRAALPGQPRPEVRTNAAGRVTFYAPIVLSNPLCLQCHGEAGSEIAEATIAELNRLYPQDAARGFKLGELRGMWAVTW